jgi:hypothetical protein
MSTIQTGKGPQDVVFFGSIDRKNKANEGNISSSYPAWYMDVQVEQLQEQIASTERALEFGYIPKDSVQEASMLLKERKQRLQDIEKSKPRLNAAQSAWLNKASTELESNIRESLFPYDAMQFGEASPRDEMHRMTRPCIAIDPILAEKCGCKVIDGKVSRNEASRALKIANKLRGAPTNVEYLRRSELTYRMQRVEPFAGGGESGRSTAAQNPS